MTYLEIIFKFIQVKLDAELIEDFAKLNNIENNSLESKHIDDLNELQKSLIENFQACKPDLMKLKKLILKNVEKIKL